VGIDDAFEGGVPPPFAPLVLTPSRRFARGSAYAYARHISYVSS